VYPLVLAVPRGRFDVVRVHVQLDLARAALGIDTDAAPHAGDDSTTVLVAPVIDTSWLHKLTRGSPYVWTEYPTGEAADEDRTVTVGLTRHRDRIDREGYDHAMSHVYGVTEATGDAALILIGRDGTGRSVRPSPRVRHATRVASAMHG
jgi:hypothetical protein